MFAIVDTRAHYKTTIVTRPHDEELRQGQSPDPLDLLYYLTTTAGAITRLDVTANQPAPDWALHQTKWTKWTKWTRWTRWTEWTAGKGFRQ